MSPRLGDFNEDLHVFGLDALRAALRIQLAPEDVARFLLACRPRSDRLRSPSIDVNSSVAARPNAGEGRDHGLLEGDRTASGPGRQWLRPAIFRRAPPKGRSHYIWDDGALCIAKQNSRASAILRWRFGPPLPLRVLARPARRLVIATKAAMGAAEPAKDLLNDRS